MAKSKAPGLFEDASISTRGAVVFFAAAATGMAFIVFAKLSALSQLQITAIPIIILAVYAYLLFRWRRLTLRDDQSGDNLYYLGFLYTLTSIAVSLYQFNLNDKAQEQIITNFGIAIATTIVGLALRVMFNQMRQDPAEVERVARLELSEAARRLRREIDTIVIELNVFQRTLQQSAMDNQRSLHEGVAQTLRDASQSLIETSKSIRTEFGESVPDLAKQVSSLSQSAVVADKALSDLGERLANLKTPELLVKLNLEPAVAEVEALIDDMREAQVSHVNSLNATLASMASAARGIHESAETLVELVEDRRKRDRQPIWRRAVDRLSGRP